MVDTESLAPGCCTLKDLALLAKITSGKNVLMFGAYCGRGARAIAKVCESLTVVEDFQSYPADWTACAKEFMRVCGEFDERISLIKNKDELWVAERHLGEYDVFYIDADYQDDKEEAIEDSGAFLSKTGPAQLIYHGITGELSEPISYNDGFLTYPLKSRLKSLCGAKG